MMSSSLYSFICMHQIFYSWCSAVYYYLFVRFNILFIVVHTFELYQKNDWKMEFSKYSQVWFFFEDLDARNTIFPLRFMVFFCFKQVCMWMMSLFCLICMRAHIFLFFRAQTVKFIGLKHGPPRVEPLLQVMVEWCIASSDIQPRPFQIPSFTFHF